MPYCPKCDMEFVEGVTVCTDCGGPLVESKEAALAMKREAEEREREMLIRGYEDLMAPGEGPGEEESEETESDAENKARAAAPALSHAYVDKGQRYEDMRSSASAFFIVGGLLAAAAILCLAGVIPLPMRGLSRYLFEGMLAVMAAGSLIVAVSSRKRAGPLKSEAAEEKAETGDIISWFVQSYTGDDLDTRLLAEDPSLSGEELALKRFELIQDLLITGRDLPDQSYVDALCDMIYSKLYEN